MLMRLWWHLFLFFPLILQIQAQPKTAQERRYYQTLEQITQSMTALHEKQWELLTHLALFAPKAQWSTQELQQQELLKEKNPAQRDLLLAKHNQVRWLELRQVLAQQLAQGSLPKLLQLIGQLPPELLSAEFRVALSSNRPLEQKQLQEISFWRSWWIKSQLLRSFLLKKMLHHPVLLNSSWEISSLLSVAPVASAEVQSFESWKQQLLLIVPQLPSHFFIQLIREQRTVEQIFVKVFHSYGQQSYLDHLVEKLQQRQQGNYLEWWSATVQQLAQPMMAYTYYLTELSLQLLLTKKIFQPKLFAEQFLRLDLLLKEVSVDQGSVPWGQLCSSFEQLYAQIGQGLRQASGRYYQEKKLLLFYYGRLQSLMGETQQCGGESQTRWSELMQELEQQVSAQQSLDPDLPLGDYQFKHWSTPELQDEWLQINLSAQDSKCLALNHFMQQSTAVGIKQPLPEHQGLADRMHAAYLLGEVDAQTLLLLMGDGGLRRHRKSFLGGVYGILRPILVPVASIADPSGLLGLIISVTDQLATEGLGPKSTQVSPLVPCLDPSKYW